MQRYPGDDIGVFLAVCDAGSFVAASRKLHMSASAVAKAIGRVERRLQIRLIQRTTRTLSLTQEGLAYRDACRSARDQIERVEFTLRDSSREPAGTVRISLPPLFGTQIIAPVLYGLARTWPRIRYEISTTTAHVNFSEGDVDLAVRIGNLPDASGLVARRLGEQSVVLCGSAGYLSNRCQPTSIEDLKDHDLIATVRNGNPVPWQFQRDGELLNWVPPSRLLLDGGLLTLSAITEGHGLGIVPRWLVNKEIAEGRIISVLDDILAGHLPIHAVWPSSPIMLPRLRVTIDAIYEASQVQLR